MGRRPATIHDANPARARADAVARRQKLSPSVAAFAVLLLLVFAPMLHAQAGVITTLVGPSLSGSGVTGDNLLFPAGVAVDSAGNIYTADATNCVVWKTQYGASSIFAGELPSTPYSCSGGSPTNTATTTPLAYPVAVAQCDGNVFIAAAGIDPFAEGGGVSEAGGSVDEVSANGSLSALPLPTLPVGDTGLLHPVAIACDAGGNVYVSSYYYASGTAVGYVNEFSPSGGAWTSNPLATTPGDIYPAIAFNPTSGHLDGIQTVAQGGGWLGPPQLGTGMIWDITQNASALTSNNSFNNGSALAIDPQGNFYVSVGASSGASPNFVDFVQASTGNATVIAGTGLTTYNGSGILSTSANLSGVSALALDSTNSDIYLADSRNSVVQRIHSLVAGPSTLTVLPTSVPQSSSATYGSLQGALNPVTGDFYYVTGVNTVNVINTNIVCPGCSRIVATIPVGANNGGLTSTLTMAIDSTRNLVYIGNTVDGNLYRIDGTTHTVTGSVSLNNPNASLLAFDPGINEIYAGGPNATTVSAVAGGTMELIGNYGYPVNSLSVNAGTHVVYAVADSCACISPQGEALIIMTRQDTPEPGALAVSAVSFPLQFAETVDATPAFIANSIAADPVSGSLFASGEASTDSFAEYYVYDVDQFTPTVSAYTQYLDFGWPPITTSLDIPNRVFYITDFDGTVNDPSSHAEMVYRIDGEAADATYPGTTAIPVFSGTPNSPHVYDVEPNPSTYQAWISGSDATDGGFVKIWDSGTQKLTASGTIPSNGGGHLFVNPSAQDAYLLDHVNGALWLINTPPWTTTPEPILSLPSGATSVTINAKNSGDAVFYTLDGTPPGLGSTPCSPLPCAVNVTTGQYLTINAIEVASGVASDVEREVFTVPAPTALGLGLSPNPTTGATLTLTATITPNPLVSSLTGTVSFAATPSGYLNPVQLCSQAPIEYIMGSWQAACNFVEAAPVSYIFVATYSGDPLNQPSSNTTTAQVNPGTTPVLGALGGSDALAINSNYPPAGSANAPLSSYNAVLYSNSSVFLLQDSVESGDPICPAIPSLSSGISSGAVYVDYANNIIYLAMRSGSAIYAAYETINLTTGACTQGPLVELTPNAFSNLEMNVDPVQGNVYVLNSFGFMNDTLYILPTLFTASSAPTKLTMDYSVLYGPIVIDPSNHLVYIDDLGPNTSGAVGTLATSGFWVYNPTATPTLQHVLGYINGSGTAVLFYAGTLLTDGAGTLVLVSNNPNANCSGATSCSNASCLNPNNVCSTGSFYGQGRPPITLINTTLPGFSFSNPATALTMIGPSPSDTYTAIGGADIDAANDLVFAFAFVNSNPQPPSGSLLEYNLKAGVSQSQQEIPLSPAGGTAMANAGYPTPTSWGQLNFNPESTELALSTPPALGITSQFCLIPPDTSLTLTQVAGTGSSSPGSTVINATSGYLYAIDSNSGGIDFVAPPPACPSTTISISPSTLLEGAVNSTYADTLTAKGGSGGPYTFTPTTAAGQTGLPPGLSLLTTGAFSGAPLAAGTFTFTVQVTDSSKVNTATATYTLIVNSALTITPTTLNNGIINGAFLQTLIGGGGSLVYTWGATGLPPGLQINASTGLISGTPTGTLTTAMIYNPSVTITDSQGNQAMQTEMITIYPQLAITPTFLLNGTVGVAYTPATLMGVGGSGSGYTYTWNPSTISEPGGYDLTPPGLSIGSTTGIVFGTPTMAGTFYFTVTVEDSLHFTATQSYVVTISGASSGPITVNDPETVTVNDSLTQVQLNDVSDPETIKVTDIAQVTVGSPLAVIRLASLPTGFVNTSYSFTLTASGGTQPYTWAVTGLPTGLSIGSTTGTISGAPTGVGTYSLTVTVTDANSNTASENLPITVNAALTISTPVILPAGDQNASYTVTITANGGLPPYNFAATGLPAGLTIGSATGTISGTAAGAGTFSFTVTVTDSASNVNSSGFTLTIDPPLTFTTPASLSPGEVGSAYSLTITVNGGASPYTFSVTGGSLPPGLIINGQGVISGTPTAVGTSPFAVTVADANQVTTTNNFSLTVDPALVITGPASLPAGTVNVAYTPTTITASGGVLPYAWSSPALPAGLSISTSGVISGTPTAAGTSSVTLKVIDGNGITATAPYSITVEASPLVIASPASLPAGEVNVPYPMTTFTAAGGAQPYSWSITGLPPGLTTNGAGAITGTPTNPVGSPFSVTVTVTDVNFITTTKDYTLTIAPPPTITGPATLPAATLNAAYTLTIIAASGGLPPYTWTATGLPAGLGIGSTTGAITGIPTGGTAGTYSVTVTVTDSAGKTGTMNYALALNSPLAITGPASLPPGALGVAYLGTTLTASGGSGLYTWSTTGLPAGLSIGVTTGAITGIIPAGSTAGTYTVVVTVTDASGSTANKTYPLTVYPPLPPLIITSPSSLPPNAYEGVAFPPTQFSATGGSGTGYAWSVTGPLGLIMSNTGVLSGTPNGGLGPSAITVTVEDSVGDTATRTYIVNFFEFYPLLITFPSSLTNADLNMGYSVGFGASGGTPPYTWSATGLPPGLNMSAVGTISGTPTVAGVFAVTVTVTDSFGYPTSAIYSLTVVAPGLGITASPGALTIVQGQSGETTLTFTPTGGYVGPVTLSCSGLPANTSCSFAQLPSGTPITAPLGFNGQQVMVQLTIWTDGVSTQHLAQSSPAPPRPGAISTAIAFWSPFSLLGLIALRRKRKLFTKNPKIFGLCVFVLLAGAMAGLAGCISGGGFGTYVTPAGTSTVTVVVTPASGSPQTVSIGLTITQQ